MSLGCSHLCSPISIFDVRKFVHEYYFEFLIDALVTSPSYNINGQYTAPLLLFSFLIGSSCCQSFRPYVPKLGLQSDFPIALTMSSTIEAGASTMYVHHTDICFILFTQQFFSFVGLGEDPRVLEIRAPELFGVCSYSLSYLIYSPFISLDR